MSTSSTSKCRVTSSSRCKRPASAWCNVSRIGSLARGQRQKFACRGSARWCDEQTRSNADIGGYIFKRFLTRLYCAGAQNEIDAICKKGTIPASISLMPKPLASAFNRAVQKPDASNSGEGVTTNGADSLDKAVRRGEPFRSFQRPKSPKASTWANSPSMSRWPMSHR
jgi:hypothetical protein